MQETGRTIAHVSGISVRVGSTVLIVSPIDRASIAVLNELKVANLPHPINVNAANLSLARFQQGNSAATPDAGRLGHWVEGR
jgi:hypothetical protein